MLEHALTTRARGEMLDGGIGQRLAAAQSSRHRRRAEHDILGQRFGPLRASFMAPALV
jgi:hypothetical protein